MFGMRTAPLWITFLLTGGCAVMQPAYETPTVSVTSFRPLPSTDITPRFEIGLHVVNPNRFPLTLKGIAYKVYIEGREVLTGASSKLPVIDAYGEGDITLAVNTNLINSLRLINDLMRQHRETYHYKLDAKLDVGDAMPALHVIEQGRVNLNQ
jgi:LEA14-like dessication related protein